MKGVLFAVALAAALPCLAGCYGAGTRVVAPNATVPVSLSRAVRRADGRLLSLAEREVVGQLYWQTMVWSMLYGAVNLDELTDISTELNYQVAALGGQAVTNLVVNATPCGMGAVWPLNWLPFWPSCAYITVQGDIIRERAR